jgi:predicted alpha/beta-fold hydrolase
VFAVDWYPSKPTTTKEINTAPDQSSSSSSGVSHKIILFLPGLGLHSRNKFCQNFVSHAYNEAGYICAVLNPRGLNIPLKSKKLWYPGLHDDTLFVLQSLERNYPNSQLFLVGYSAGTNLVMRTLSDKTKVKSLKGAMCVCVNRDYLTTRNNLENSFRGLIYSSLMTMAYKVITLFITQNTKN